MKKSLSGALALFSTLVLISAISFAQASSSTTTTQGTTTTTETKTDSGTKSKQKMKAAGHETKEAAKDVGSGVAEGTKKGVHATGTGFKKLGDKMTGNENLVDINSASKADLVALPGIGEVYAQKIIDNRPYANKSQLVSKHVIPGSTYAKVKTQIVAKQK
jgi:DNA uptake protein ComE-like DNA-binding protein